MKTGCSWSDSWYNGVQRSLAKTLFFFLSGFFFQTVAYEINFFNKIAP